MTRRLLNLLTAVSLLMCAVVVVLWVRSYRGTHHLFQFTSRSGVAWEVACRDGALRLDNRPQLEREAAEWEIKAQHLRSENEGFLDEHLANNDRWHEAIVARDGEASRSESDVARRLSAASKAKWREEAAHPDAPGREPPLGSDRRIAPVVAAVAATLPAARAHASASAGLRRRRARVRGECPACGYDLTGNIRGVCPECGNAK